MNREWVPGAAALKYLHANYPLGSGPDALAFFKKMLDEGKLNWRPDPAFTEDEWSEMRSYDSDAPDYISYLNIEVRFTDVRNLCSAPGKKRTSSGAPIQKDWIAALQMLVVYVHDNGIPETQTALIKVVQDWFVNQDPEKYIEPPSRSAVQKIVAPIWRELRSQ